MKRNIKIIVSIVIIMTFIAASLGLTAIAVNSIKLNTTNIRLQVGKTYALKVTIIPADASNKKLSFLSANRKIASVDKNGKIKGIIPGKTVITVTSASNKKAVVKCNVTVIKDYGTVKILKTETSSKGTDNKMVADYIQKQTGVKIEPVWVPNTASGADMFTLKIAAGEDFDIYSITSINNFTNYLNNGTLMNIGDVINELGPNIKKRIPEEYWGWVKDEKGGIYAIPCTYVSAGVVAMIREDWIKNLNLKMPETVKEFEEVLKSFKQKYDSAPLFIDNQIRFHYDQVLCSAFLPNGYDWWKSRDGTYLPPEMHPDYKNYLSTMVKWYKEGLINAESFTNKWRETMETGKIGVYIGWNTLPFYANEKVRKETPESEYVMLQPLKGNYDNGYMDKRYPQNVTVLSVRSKNPEGAIRYIDWLLENSTNYIIGTGGIEGVHYKYINKDKRTIESLPDAGNYSQTGYVMDIFNWGARVIGNYVAQRTYDFWDLYSEGKIRKTFVPIDMKYGVNELQLKSASKLNDVQTALVENKIKFIMGKRPLNEWDQFIEELKKIGLDEMIKEKNEVYSKKIK